MYVHIHIETRRLHLSTCVDRLRMRQTLLCLASHVTICLMLHVRLGTKIPFKQVFARVAKFEIVHVASTNVAVNVLVYAHLSEHVFSSRHKLTLLLEESSVGMQTLACCKHSHDVKLFAFELPENIRSSSIRTMNIRSSSIRTMNIRSSSIRTFAAV